VLIEKKGEKVKLKHMHSIMF